MGIEENKHDKKNLMMISFSNIMFTFQFISLKVFFFSSSICFPCSISCWALLFATLRFSYESPC